MTVDRIGRWALVAVLAASLGAAACSDNNDGVTVGEAPNMVTYPGSEVSFSEVALGSSETVQIEIANLGPGTLRINAIKLVEETTTDEGGVEFTKGEDWINSLELAPDDAPVAFSVTYNPKDQSPDTGYIQINSNDPTKEGFRLPLVTSDLAPEIFHKPVVTFGRTPPVSEDTRNKINQISELQNLGQAPLKITQIAISPSDSDFSLAFPDSITDEDWSDDADAGPTTLEPGAKLPLRVFFNPKTDLPSEAELIFYSNDPDNPTYTVALIGNSQAPCMRLTNEDEINFGEGAIGYANNKTVTIENCSATTALELSSIEVIDDGGGVYEVKEGSLPAPLPGETVTIQPEGTVSFVLTYTPTDTSTSSGVLAIQSNDVAKSPPNRPMEIPIVGTGTNNVCPTAVAEARLEGTSQYRTEISTIPLKWIELRGSMSTDNGSIASYEWNIVSRPPGSTARPDPGPNVADPKLFLDLAGDYELELTVYDEQGLAACEPAKVRIRATPDEDIHVQLVWNTPADDDQTVGDGADLDLHFLHPLGYWNQEPYDIFWNNKEPNNPASWGGPSADDDPSLDIDDTNGAGPENVNLNNPEGGLDYAVGVYYYDAHGFGPSYATVRIYIQGSQRFEYRDMYMPSRGYFWRVAVISWPAARQPNQGIIRINQVQCGFPGSQSGSPATCTP